MIVRARHPGYDPTVLPEVLQANASARPEDTREVQTLRTALGADVGDLSRLRAYPNLRVLEILFAPGLETLRGLEACPHLTTLSVRWCPRLREVSALSSLRQLVVLGLEGCPEVGSLDGLGEYPCLERLVLGSCRIQDVAGVSMPALRSVTLDSLHQLRTIAWLGETRYLSGVRMLDVPALDSLHGLEGCTQLTVLQLYAAEAREGGDSALRDITALKGCDSLTRLALTGCTQLEDIQVLRTLHKLAEVYLTRSAVSDISPLADLPLLTELGLVGCVQLRDVTALKRNAGLRRLYLDNSGVPVEQIRGRLRKVSKPSEGGDIGRKEFEEIQAHNFLEPEVARRMAEVRAGREAELGFVNDLLPHLVSHEHIGGFSVVFYDSWGNGGTGPAISEAEAVRLFSYEDGKGRYR